MIVYVHHHHQTQEQREGVIVSILHAFDLCPHAATATQDSTEAVSAVKTRRHGEGRMKLEPSDQWGQSIEWSACPSRNSEVLNRRAHSDRSRGLYWRGIGAGARKGPILTQAGRVHAGASGFMQVASADSPRNPDYWSMGATG